MRMPVISRGQALAVFLPGITVLLVSIINVLTVPDSARPWQLILLILAFAATLIGLWLLSLSRRLHPGLKRFTRLKLHPAQIKALADSGRPIPLQLGSSSYQLSVTPSPVFDESFELIEVTDKGERRARISDVMTYAGALIGQEKSSDVRLAITERALEGYVRMEKEWWFIEPMRKFRQDAGTDDFIAYRTADLNLRLDFGHDELAAVATEITEHADEIGGLEPPQGVSPRIGINFAIDSEYLQQASWTPYSAYQHNIIVLNAVNGVYQRELGCEFELKNLVVSPATLTSTDAGALLNQLEETVKDTALGDMRLLSQRQATHSEVVHLTTAKNLKGRTLGVAWRPGVYSLSQHQLIWVGGGGLFGGPPNLGYMNMMVMAHELGHNFNGAHEAADEWCVANFVICWDRVRSLMWPALYDDSQDVFSDGSRNPSHNNRQRISNNLSNGRNQDFYF